MMGTKVQLSNVVVDFDTIIDLLVDEANKPSMTETEEFDKKYRILEQKEVEEALRIDKFQFLKIVNQIVDCVGCRGSAENFFQRLTTSDEEKPGFHPFSFNGSGTVAICEDKRNHKFVFQLFHCPSAMIKGISESLIKSKRGRRCSLHSIVSQRMQSIQNRIFEHHRAGEIFIYAALQAFRRSFEEAADKKKGVSELELVCEAVEKSNPKSVKKRRRKKKTPEVLEKQDVPPFETSSSFSNSQPKCYFLNKEIEKVEEEEENATTSDIIPEEPEEQSLKCDDTMHTEQWQKKSPAEIDSPPTSSNGNGNMDNMKRVDRQIPVSISYKLLEDLKMCSSSDESEDFLPEVDKSIILSPKWIEERAQLRERIIRDFDLWRIEDQNEIQSRCNGDNVTDIRSHTGNEKEED